MKKTLVSVLVWASLGGVAACRDAHDHDHGHDHDHDHEHPAAQSGGAQPGHSGHGSDHGPQRTLGSQTSGGYVVDASLVGDVAAGKEAGFTITIQAPASGPAVSAVRLWVGSEDGKGSMRAKAEAEDGGWHGHAEVPSPLAAGSRLWVELETADGVRRVAGFALPQ